MILLLTNKEDFHPDPVIEYFLKHSVPFFRLNTECILTDYKISFINKDGVASLQLLDIHRNVTIHSDSIKSVWERRPSKAEDSPVKDKKIRDLCLKEATEVIANIQYFLEDRFHLGHHLFDRRADSRMLQMKCANKAGFKTPYTIISNDHNYTSQSVTQVESLAQKSLAVDSFDVDNELDYYVFWTKKRDSIEITEYPKESFELTYNYLQEYINKQFELRITVVCNEVFCCKIESQHLGHQTGQVDFRQGYEYGLKYSIFELPSEIKQYCFQYLDLMHLNFGCFDILVSNEDEYIFLECNPNGQWAWIEEETDLPISKAIAEHLISGK